MMSLITVSVIMIIMGVGGTPQKFQGVRSPLTDIFVPKVVNWFIFIEMNANEEVV